jgi:hypothetical protein
MKVCGSRASSGWPVRSPKVLAGRSTDPASVGRRARRADAVLLCGE